MNALDAAGASKFFFFLANDNPFQDACSHCQINSMLEPAGAPPQMRLLDPGGQLHRFPS
jgi:hypothetical protein